MRTGMVLGSLVVGAALLVGCKMKKGEAPAPKEGEAAVEQAVAKAQTTCPIMGAAVDKSIYVDHEGKRVYLCCDACVEEFKKDPAKHVKKLEDEGVTIEEVPAEGAEEPAAEEEAKEEAKEEAAEEAKEE